MKRSLSRDLRRSLVYLKPYRSGLLVAIVMTLGSGALLAIEPLLHKAIFDRVADPGARSAGVHALVAPVAVLVGAVLLRHLLEAAGVLLNSRVRLRVSHDIFTEATGRLHTLPLAYHREHGVGDTMTRLDKGIASLLEGISSLAFQMVPSLVYLVVSAIVMVKLSPMLAVLAIGFVVPPALLGKATAPKLVERERVIFDRWCTIYGRLHEVLTGIKTVKAFAREADEHAQFVDESAVAQEEAIRTAQIQTGLASWRNLCANLGRAAVIGAGGVLVIRGEIGFGTLVAFVGYVAGLYAPAQALLGLYETTRRAELGLEAIFGVLDADDAVADSEGAADVETIDGELRFEEVTFHHDDGGPPALHDVSFEIRKGERVAVVGPSGAGKSTLADLVLRLHDPSGGTVRVDGHDLRGIAQRSLREKIGVVTQEPFMFQDTVAANVRYGRADATREEIESAAKVARADAFIRRLPQGYDTVIGRGGAQLSGGQRRRIAIARMLLKDPSLVVLDEPTSGLDVEAELAVHDAVDELAAGRTTLILTHCMTSTLHADRVLVLDRGRLVEAGRPAELLRRGGLYRRMMHLSHAPRRLERVRDREVRELLATAA